MNAARRQRIGAAFAAAENYDRSARIQARAATALAADIATLPLPPAPRLLEIGCGTGLLTAALSAQGVGGQWLITDLAPAMLERTQARLGTAPHCRFAVLDGEHGPMPAEAPFDLITASLAFQWFDDLGAALDRLSGWLAPGGWLAFTTLAHGTFAEWHKAHAALGALPGTPPFPPLAALGQMLPGAEVRLSTLSDSHESARAFLGSIKAIGAGTPAPGHIPVYAGTLRKIMRTFEQGGCIATYRVATVLWQKPRP